MADNNDYTPDSASRANDNPTPVPYDRHLYPTHPMESGYADRHPSGLGEDTSSDSGSPITQFSYSAPHPQGDHHVGREQSTAQFTAPLGAPAEHLPYEGGSTEPVGITPTQTRSTTTSVLVAVLAAGLIGGGVGAGGVALFGNKSSSSGSNTIASAPADASNAAATSGSITSAAAIASKFTADIRVAGSSGTAVGSGIVLTSDGSVLTNNHVVSGAGQGGKISVTLPDGSTHSATITGTAPSYDLAVIKVDNASGLTAAVMGNTKSVQVGEQVVAVGSPENLSNTVTSGIVSALSRTVTASDEGGSSVTVYNGLQTDTAINPGNSGGPLVNTAGQVVGVNSAVDTGQATSGGVQAFGLGFAIPVDTAKRVAQQLISEGQATKPVLGVSGSVQGQTTSAAGAQISGVQGDGAAAKAGVKKGDVVTKIDGVQVGNYADLMAQVLRHTPGQQVSLTVKRNGTSTDMTATLGSAKDTATTTVSEKRQQQGQQQQSPFGDASPFGGESSPFGGSSPFGESNPFGN